MIVVAAIVVVFAIGLVVFAVVGDKIVKREAIMAGDEINRSCRASLVPGVEVRRALNANGESACLPCITFQKLADVITIFSIPLGPSAVGRERAHLVETASVPCLGDQLAFRQDGIVGETFEQRRIG